MTRARGYSLPMVVMLMSVLAAAGTAAVVAMSATAATTGTMINRRQTFYACDGIGRAAMVKSREYMKRDVSPTTTELMTSVCGSASACPLRSSYAPAGFTVDTLTLSTNNTSATAPLPNGPFRNMNARQTQVRLVVEATKVSTTARCRIDENITLGELGLFQFFVFSDGYADVLPSVSLSLNGRVHVNGDLCAAASSGQTLRIKEATASGRIRTNCNNFSPAQARNSTVENTASFLRATGLDPAAAASYTVMRQTGESGCASCTPTLGTGAWRSYANTRWGGNLQDVDHSVPALRLPFVGSAQVQDGVNMSGNGSDNSQRMRALVDPVRAADGADVRAHKLAFKADIRIINGVWYKRDRANPSNWPGTVIWSDHPGTRQTAIVGEEGIEPGSRNVGQAQLGFTTIPQRYSYYETNAAGTMLTDNGTTPSVVSYGSLRLTAAGTNTWHPAFFKGAGVGYCNSVGDALLSARATAGCLAGANNPIGLHFLQASRSGMQDFRVRAANLLPPNASAHMILPLNFDVAAFAAALTSNIAGSGELGTHFLDNSDDTEEDDADTAPDFNGIVYIANLYSDQLQDSSFSAVAGNVTAPPPLWPSVDSVANPAAPVQPVSSFSSGAATVSRLPFPLCSTGLGGTAYTNTASTPFVIPSCAAGADGRPGSADDPTTRPNAVRVYNAGTLNPAVFPEGLSIVSNGPIYVLGNANTASDPAPRQPPSVSIVGNWKPLMVAGDSVTLLSAAWSDESAHWGLGAGFTGARNAPVDTKWLIAVIGGNVEGTSIWGGGITNFPRFLENWTGRTTTLTGSLVVGYRSVYQRQPWTPLASGVSVYNPPVLNWTYDANLARPSDQPPGTPSFFVQAIQQWARD